MNLSWYVRRMSRMSPPEIAMRGRDEFVKLLWRRHWVRDVEADRSPLPTAPAFAATLPGIDGPVPAPARDRLVRCADRLLAGRWPVFALERTDLDADPDWFADPRTGRRGADSRYCFHIDHRSEDVVGNVKYVWELSRHHHLTVLAAAFYLTGDTRYADRIAEHLRSWWRRNPFLTGVHWTSGIEVGVRLLAWVWVRRLLDAWPGVEALFERNPTFLRQAGHHQRYLAALRSHGSSANNHVIAEAAGLFAAACAFPWFPESVAWRDRAAATLRREIARQTFPCGVNRELATEYHGFVLELGLAAALEGEAADHPLGDDTWEWLRRMTDALAAFVDVTLRPPRQGDSDEGTALLLDDPASNRWSGLLATGAALFGRLDWWPVPTETDVRTTLWSALAKPPRTTSAERPSRRPSVFPQAGMVILRDPVHRWSASANGAGGHDEGGHDEIWCRCDSGPLGFLSVAAHGHADALAIELRCGGVEILTDPGTYCYHGEREWRRYFRSTLAHNTLEVGGESQSVDGGPFMWLRAPASRAIRIAGIDDGAQAVWEAEHDGYARLSPPATHRRRVMLDRRARALTVFDRLDSSGEHPCRLAFHLGEAVTCELAGTTALLRWQTPQGALREAELALPGELSWSAVRGQTDPPLGWYSPSFDVRRATTVLIGSGRLGHGREVRSSFHVRV